MLEKVITRKPFRRWHFPGLLKREYCISPLWEMLFEAFHALEGRGIVRVDGRRVALMAFP